MYRTDDANEDTKMTTTATHPNAVHLSTWENVKRALESAARKSNGEAVVKIAVLVDCRGNPIRHTKPSVTRIEPRENGHGCGWLEALAE